MKSNLIKKISRTSFAATFLALGLVVGFGLWFNPDKANSAGQTIVIDPGHGSAANKRDYEGATELEIGLKLKSVLEKKGYKVVMTRTTNGEAIGGVSSGEDNDNIARAKIANDANASLSIRLHSDSRSDDSFWVVYPSKSGKDRTGFSGPLSDTVIPQSKEAAGLLKNAMVTAGFSGIIKGEGEYSSSGKGDILIFSAHTKFPVITLELYGNESSALRAKYKKSDVQQKVANTIAESVESFLGSTGQSTTTGSSSSPDTAPTSKTTTQKTCPAKFSSGPSAGEDSINEIAGSIASQYPVEGVDSSSEGASANLPASSNISNKAAQIAMGEVGKKYTDDKTPYNNYNGTQWCAFFVTWAMKQAGLNIPTMGGSKEVLRWFKSSGHSVFTNPAQAGAGDVVVWDRGGDKGHIGLVVTNDTGGQKLGIVEGNTSNNEVKYYVYTYEQVKTKQKGLVGFGRW